MNRIKFRVVVAKSEGFLGGVKPWRATVYLEETIEDIRERFKNTGRKLSMQAELEAGYQNDCYLWSAEWDGAKQL